MAFNTGNALGSTDPRDLSDNAENLDRFANGTDPAYNDRLSKSRKSLAGMESDFATDQSERATTFANFLASSGYEFLGEYAGGIEVTEYNQIIRESGEFWRPAASTSLPYTTTGAGMPESGAFVAVGDAALRQEIGSGIFRADSLANLESTNGRFDGDAARLVSGTGRDGDFRWDSSDLSATLVLASATSDSVDDTTDTINDVDHPFSDGDGVITQTAVNGLTAHTVYWVVNSTTGSYQLSATFGGGAVDLTGTTNFTVDSLLDPSQAIWVTPSGDKTGSSGAWLRSDITTVLPKWYGSADSKSIQSAINFSMYSGGSLASRPVPVLINDQGISVSETIHIGYGTSFKGGLVRGIGQAYVGNDTVHVGTALDSSIIDAPTVAIQGARNTIFEELSIIGPARSDLDPLTGLDYEDASAVTSEASWDSALSNAGITPGKRYAPHVAVAIDPYSGSKPATAYPDVPYPSFLGAVSQYGKSTSNAPRVGITAEGFEVGFAVQPSDADANGDFCDFSGSTVSRCKYGVSVGNSQSRAIDLSSVKFSYVHTCVTTNKHGRQSGKIAAEIKNLHGAGFIYQIFDFASLSFTAPVHFDTAYFESLFRIGSLPSASSAHGVVSFSNSTFNFKDFSTLDAVPGELIENASPTGASGIGHGLSYKDCIFRVRSVAYLGGQPTSLKGSYIVRDNDPGKSYEAHGSNALMGGFVPDPLVSSAYQALGRIYDVGNTSRQGGMYDFNGQYDKTGRSFCIPHYLSSGRCETAGTWDNKPIKVFSLSAGARSSVSRTDRAITFTNGNITNVDRAYRESYMPGCIMVHRGTGTVMFVRSVDTGTGVTTVEMQNNYISDGAGGYDIFDTNFDPATDTWYCINGLIYSPERMLWGTITSGSNVITNVRSAGGVDASNYGLVVGDRLAGELYEELPFSGSNALSITGIDTASNTITLAGNANFSADRYPLPFWYRQAPANAASR